MGVWGIFVLVAAAQGLYGPALIRSPRRPVLLLTGVGGNLAIIVLYLVTRTVGVPFFGPHAGEVEEVGVIDLAATLAEVALVVALAALLWSVRRSGSRPLGREEARVPVTVETGSGLSRRDFLRAAGFVGAIGVSGGALGAHAGRSAGQETHHGGVGGAESVHGVHGGNGVVGDVDLSRFDPTGFLRDFYRGELRREGGRTVRGFAYSNLLSASSWPSGQGRSCRSSSR